MPMTAKVEPRMMNMVGTLVSTSGAVKYLSQLSYKHIQISNKMPRSHPKLLNTMKDIIIEIHMYIIILQSGPVSAEVRAHRDISTLYLQSLYKIVGPSWKFTFFLSNISVAA